MVSLVGVDGREIEDGVLFGVVLVKKGEVVEDYLVEKDEACVVVIKEGGGPHIPVGVVMG